MNWTIETELRSRGFMGVVGLVVTDLTGTPLYTWNEMQSFPAASTIKVPLLIAALQEAQHQLTAGDSAAFQHANALVHAQIVVLTDNALAQPMIAFLDDRVERLNRVSFHHDDGSRHREHLELARAVLAGRESVAFAAATLHIDHERERVLDALPSHPHYAGH